MDDAVEILELCIPDNSLARVQLYFPDPWHKKKHHKRRIVQPAWVALVQRKLQPGGILHMATDWEKLLRTHDGSDETRPRDSTMRQGLAASRRAPSWRPETKFERRGEKTWPRSLGLVVREKRLTGKNSFYKTGKKKPQRGLRFFLCSISAEVAFHPQA